MIYTIIIFILSFNLTAGQDDIDNASHYNIELDRSTARVGETINLNINLDLEKNFYIYSSNPNKSLSPTSIEWEDDSFFNQIGILKEPQPKIKYDSNLSMDVGYHMKNVKFIQELQISNELKPGNYSILGTFIYQVCDPIRCIPHWDEFNISLEIISGIAKEEYIIPIQTEFENDLYIDTSSNVEELDEVISKGLLSFILFAIGMGFLALLTPCVFPMIPITVSFFTKEGEKEDASPLFSASIYTIGIIVIFSLLGLLLAFSLGATGANQLASNPWINLFIAGLFIYFAFSLFGHYEIQLPSSLRQFSSQNENKGGVIGILFMALTFTLTSFTCTVQFVGLLLVAASQGEYFWPVLGMVAFSSAFAFPFFFLALFPQYLAKLPKSGGWLNSVKVTMGFLELGAAMKFLSNADLVWQWGIFTQQVVLSVWIVISFMMGFYLLGKIKLPHDTDIDSIGVPRLSLSLLFMSFGFYLTAGLFGQPIHGLIDSYLPPKEEISQNNHIKGTEYDKISWIDNLDEALILSKIENKPIFIDFTGYTCTNCRWMETNVFEEPEVKNMFYKFILVKLYTDGGENHKENRKLEVDRFGTAALPFYVILNTNNEELARFPGMDPNVEKFVAFLENGLNGMKNS